MAAYGDGSVSVSVPWRRRNYFTRRGSILRSSSAPDPVLLRGADRLSSEMKRFREVAGLEPLVDEAERRAKEAERMRYLRQKARSRVHRQRLRDAEDKIRDFDVKQGGEYFYRIDSTFVDLTRFDLDEESPLGPMRFTDTVYKSKDDYELCEGINFFSVRIAVSDVGFPIHVYGTVIARDSLDPRCVYLFRRDRDHCQVISSKDESLILTGPKRGLGLVSQNHVEIDLKIKDHQGQDKELSKGVISISGTERRELKQFELESGSLATRLSTVEVMYGVVVHAVEGTIAIGVVQGDFTGKITAHTTSILNYSMVLYDSKVVGAVTGDGIGVMKLMQPAVSVFMKDKLVIVAQTSDGSSERTIEFTPKINGREEENMMIGVTKLRVKVAWSIMDF